MTEVLGVCWPDWGGYELTVRGHATGSEKVCAAVSGIVYALAGMLANDEETTILTQEIRPGDADISFSGGEKALGAMRMACIGLMQLEKAEPDKVRCKISEKIF